MTVEVDPSAHSNFDLKNVASFFRYVPRMLYNFLAHCQDDVLVVWISVPERRRVWIAMMFVHLGELPGMVVPEL